MSVDNDIINMIDKHLLDYEPRWISRSYPDIIKKLL